MNKSIIRSTVLLMAVMVLAVAVPLAVKADKLVTPPTGGICQDDTDCSGATFGVSMICGAATRCVPATAERKMGTFCAHAADCVQGSGQLTLTCDTNKQICIGSVINVACSDPFVVFNTTDEIGWLSTDLPVEDRCDEGLFCDTTNTGTCQNDFGGAYVPTDKLGDTATDIRDQIRGLINIALGFLGVAGVIVTIYGGALWMSAAGDDEKVEKAKKTIVSGLIGLVIIGIAWTIVSYVLTVTQDIA